MKMAVIFFLLYCFGCIVESRITVATNNPLARRSFRNAHGNVIQRSVRLFGYCSLASLASILSVWPLLFLVFAFFIMGMLLHWLLPHCKVPNERSNFNLHNNNPTTSFFQVPLAVISTHPVWYIHSDMPTFTAVCVSYVYIVQFRCPAWDSIFQWGVKFEGQLSVAKYLTTAYHASPNMDQYMNGRNLLAATKFQITLFVNPYPYILDKYFVCWGETGCLYHSGKRFTLCYCSYNYCGRHPSRVACGCHIEPLDRPSSTIIITIHTNGKRYSFLPWLFIPKSKHIQQLTPRIL